MRRAMEVRAALNPAFFLSGVVIFALVLVLRALHSGIGCNSIGADSQIIVGAPRETEDSDRAFSSRAFGYEKLSLADPEVTIAQFLKEKAAQGHLVGNQLSRELAGLDLSSQALLKESLREVATGQAVAAARPDDEWGLFHFSYGVSRVIRRLVVCSAYRIAMNEFAVVTLSPDFTLPTANPDFKDLAPKDPSVSRICTWRPGNVGSSATIAKDATLQTGVADFHWVGENHGTSYDVVIVRCTFSNTIGADFAGGFLYLNLTHASSSENFEKASELVPVFRELPKGLDSSLYGPSSSSRRRFPYDFAYCSGPVFTDLNAAHVKQFLMYHHSLLGGSVHFFLYYTRVIDRDTMAVLQPLINAGKLTVVDFQREKEYHTWYHSQNLALNDCLYRTRILANWTLFWDLDEYLHVIPPLTLSGLLEQYKDVPSISFGKIDFSLTHCGPASKNATGVGKWAVERLLYREHRPICGQLCHGPKGARKWMANPRMTDVGRIHSSTNISPLKGRGRAAAPDAAEEVLISTDVALMYHYRGLASSKDGLMCQQVHDQAATSNSSEPIMDGRVPLDADSQLAGIVSSTFRPKAESLATFTG